MNKKIFSITIILLIILLSSISFADYNESFISTTDGIQVMLKEVAANSYILTILNGRDFNDKYVSSINIITEHSDKQLSDNFKVTSGFVLQSDVLSVDSKSEKQTSEYNVLDRSKEYFVSNNDYASRTTEG